MSHESEKHKVSMVTNSETLFIVIIISNQTTFMHAMLGKWPHWLTCQGPQHNNHNIAGCAATTWTIQLSMQPPHEYTAMCAATTWIMKLCIQPPHELYSYVYSHHMNNAALHATALHVAIISTQCYVCSHHINNEALHTATIWMCAATAWMPLAHLLQYCGINNPTYSDSSFEECPTTRQPQVQSNCTLQPTLEGMAILHKLL